MPEPSDLNSAILLTGELCARHLEFVALELEVECRSTHSDTPAEVVFTSVQDWRRSRWLAPGATCVVVGAPEPPSSGAIALDNQELSQAAVLSALDLALLRRQAPNPRDQGWLGWTQTGLETLSVLHNLNNAISRALVLAEVSAARADPSLQKHLKTLADELLKAGSVPRGLWDRIALAQRSPAKIPFADALWEVAESFPWPSSARPEVSVSRDLSRTLQATLPETWTLADAVFQTLTSPGSTLRAELQEPPGLADLDFADKRSLGGEADWLRLSLAWPSGGAQAPAEALERVVRVLRGGGRRGASELSVWLPA